MTQERWFPLPGMNCGFYLTPSRRRHVNGSVVKVEITTRSVHVTVRVHKGFRTRKRVYRIVRAQLSGWSERPYDLPTL